jgi:hypothetical protein
MNYTRADARESEGPLYCYRMTCGTLCEHVDGQWRSRQEGARRRWLTPEATLVGVKCESSHTITAEP